jgi:hypothetical protein
VIIFGPAAKIGSWRTVSHIERRDVFQIGRQADVTRIEGKTRDGILEIERTWFLLSPDATSAEKVEHQLTSGERVHFGFDADIMGMICNSGDHLNTINVPMRTIMQLCVKAGFELAPWSKPREKQQDYEIVSKSSTNSSSTPGSCT